ncbi:hypothetical protein T265_09635 [Opisthorchis viverrini]|uniref:Uncharacterized protein n=1 Tax=Opisthorchis viverrini TaxID=6198 RepID=A0A074ZG45_OPIVI|nr:hypothetical protein T265_09635 [Opisthorchis viverrini]KER22210.1 hypothetical protein T265_09635 [Opisthorchis viverrini]
MQQKRRNSEIEPSTVRSVPAKSRLKIKKSTAVLLHTEAFSDSPKESRGDSFIEPQQLGCLEIAE